MEGRCWSVQVGAGWITVSRIENKAGKQRVVERVTLGGVMSVSRTQFDLARRRLGEKVRLDGGKMYNCYSDRL